MNSAQVFILFDTCYDWAQVEVKGFPEKLFPIVFLSSLLNAVVLKQ